MKIDLDDILIVPAIISEIDSRKEVNILDENNMLRIFTAPMFDVINEKNIKTYNDNKIYGIIPRKSKYNLKHINSGSFNQFISYGLDDIINIYLNNDIEIEDKHYVLIDVANGHMIKLINTCEKLKQKYKDKLVLMTGNIANSETYKVYNDIGLEFIKCGIGNGFVCTTTQHTSIGYPMASLILEINEIKKSIKNPITKVIADGGIRTYSDMIKLHCLGADYIMIGSLFNKSLESSGKCYIMENNNYLEIDNHKAKQLFEEGYDVYKEYRGMSTKSVQRELERKTIRTSEGITKYNKVEYKLDSWVENYKDYLTSTLSYTNNRNLNDFIGNTKYIEISQNAYRRFNK
jgi:IMP dehydrogenase/GMP reductase